MTAPSDPWSLWTEDNRVLAQIGAALYRIDTLIPVEIPNHLADAALAAWSRDDIESELSESEAGRLVRHRAGSLALIGAAIEARGARRTADSVSVELDAWLIGQALDTADDQKLITGPAPPRRTFGPRFITIDLDITGRSRQPLDGLVGSLTRRGTIQTDHEQDDGRRFVSFALGQQHDTIDANLTALIATIEQLAPTARCEWDNAASRVFNIGIEAGSEPEQPVIVVSPEMIASAAAFGCGITLTHYPNHNRHAIVRHTTIR